jgi:mannitol-1-/sugar-/sorbitol-6-phosphatase
MAAPSRHTLSVDALLFDLDGTLADSTDSVDRVWRQMAALLDKNPAEVVGRFHGMTGSQTLRTIDPTLSPRRVAELNDTLIDLEVADSAGVTAVPGALQALDGLPADRWAIVTSCPSRLAWARIDAAGLPHPTTVVTAEDVTHSKPHPEPYLLGAQRLGRDPRDCLAFEDAPAGVASALAAACQVLALRTSHRGSFEVDSVADLAGVTVEQFDGHLQVSY